MKRVEFSLLFFQPVLLKYNFALKYSDFIFPPKPVNFECGNGFMRFLLGPGNDFMCFPFGLGNGIMRFRLGPGNGFIGYYLGFLIGPGNYFGDWNFYSEFYFLMRAIISIWGSCFFCFLFSFFRALVAFLFFFISCFICFLVGEGSSSTLTLMLSLYQWGYFPCWEPRWSRCCCCRRFVDGFHFAMLFEEYLVSSSCCECRALQTLHSYDRLDSFSPSLIPQDLKPML